jgi:hypothetical protein
VGFVISQTFGNFAPPQHIVLSCGCVIRILAGRS